MGLEAATLALIFKAVTAVAAIGTTTVAGVSASRSNVAAKRAKSQAEQRVRLSQQASISQGDIAAAGVETPKDLSRRLGRLALISTSPRGILGPEPVGRRKLLGN